MRDSLGPRARDLLDVARLGDDPSAADRARVRRGIAMKIAAGVAVGTAVATTAKAAAGAAAGAGSSAAATVTFGIGSKILFGAAFVGMVSVGVASYSQATHEYAPPLPAVTASAETHVLATASARPRSRPSSVTTAKPARSDVSDVVPGSVHDEETEAPAARAPSTAQIPSASPRPIPRASASAAPTASTASPEPAPPALQVRSEAVLLGEAQAAIHAGDGTRALSLLDEHAQKFPHAGLSEEREAARVLALCAAGDEAAARAAADVFLRAHPRSIAAGRVESSCARRPGRF